MSSSSSHHDNQCPNMSVGQSSQPSAYGSNRKCIESTAINSSSSPTRPVCTTSPDENPTIANHSEIEDELEEAALRLGTSVFLSATFTTTIITAFLSLAEDVIRKKGLDFELALFFCILAATCNVSNVLVCGRACILAYDHKYSRRPSFDRKEYSKQLEAISRIQQVSLWVQGLGQTLFGIAILYTIWQMIQNRILVSVIYGFASILQVVVYGVGFWRISWAESMILPTSRWFLYLVRHRWATGEDVRQ